MENFAFISSYKLHHRLARGESLPDSRTHGPKIEGGPPHEPRRTYEVVKKKVVKRESLPHIHSIMDPKLRGTTSSEVFPLPRPCRPIKHMGFEVKNAQNMVKEIFFGFFEFLTKITLRKVI
jgi:hypothetical protein